MKCSKSYILHKIVRNITDKHPNYKMRQVWAVARSLYNKSHK